MSRCRNSINLKFQVWCNQIQGITVSQLSQEITIKEANLPVAIIPHGVLGTKIGSNMCIT